MPSKGTNKGSGTKTPPQSSGSAAGTVTKEIHAIKLLKEFLDQVPELCDNPCNVIVFLEALEVVEYYGNWPKEILDLEQKEPDEWDGQEEADAEFRSNRRKAFATIRGRIPAELAHLYVGMRPGDAKGIVRKVIERFCSMTPGAIQALRIAFDSCTMLSTGLIMERYASHLMLQHKHILKVTKRKANTDTETQLCTTLINGLLDEFMPVKIHVNMINSGLVFNVVVALLVNFAMDNGLLNLKRGGKISNAQLQLTAAKKRVASDEACRNYAAGHCRFAEKCRFKHVGNVPQTPKSNGNPQSQKSGKPAFPKGSCYECGSTSHLRPACPNKKKATEEKKPEKAVKQFMQRFQDLDDVGVARIEAVLASNNLFRGPDGVYQIPAPENEDPPALVDSDDDSDCIPDLKYDSDNDSNDSMPDLKDSSDDGDSSSEDELRNLSDGEDSLLDKMVNLRDNPYVQPPKCICPTCDLPGNGGEGILAYCDFCSPPCPRCHQCDSCGPCVCQSVHIGPVNEMSVSGLQHVDSVVKTAIANSKTCKPKQTPLFIKKSPATNRKKTKKRSIMMMVARPTLRPQTQIESATKSTSISTPSDTETADVQEENFMQLSSSTTAYLATMKTSKKTGEIEIIADSAATEHGNPVWEAFIPGTIEDCNFSIQLGDGSKKGKSEFRGSVLMQPLPEHLTKIQLNKVLYLPACPFFVIAERRFDDAGAAILKYGNQLTISTGFADGKMSPDIIIKGTKQSSQLYHMNARIVLPTLNK